MHANALQGQSGIHEDEIMGVSLDASLAKEEAAEQDVVRQLRLRAASLERDLLQRSLDGLAPNSKVRCPLAPCAMPSSLCNTFTPLQCLHPSAMPLCLCIMRECVNFIRVGIDPHGCMCSFH